MEKGHKVLTYLPFQMPKKDLTASLGENHLPDLFTEDPAVRPLAECWALSSSLL